MQPKRKLTAIMFTDINGFMVSMAKDEFSAAIFTDLINIYLQLNIKVIFNKMYKEFEEYFKKFKK
ncbi:MAG: hypothetical protein ISR95_09610 [Candidatus Marinimicrobia bacterium]|nr:hypothetical protein [Candidatus Neomarinimicrobiota bacterium]